MSRAGLPVFDGHRRRPCSRRPRRRPLQRRRVAAPGAEVVGPSSKFSSPNGSGIRPLRGHQTVPFFSASRTPGWPRQGKWPAASPRRRRGSMSPLPRARGRAGARRQVDDRAQALVALDEGVELILRRHFVGARRHVVRIARLGVPLRCRSRARAGRPASRGLVEEACSRRWAAVAHAEHRNAEDPLRCRRHHAVEPGSGSPTLINEAADAGRPSDAAEDDRRWRWRGD